MVIRQRPNNYARVGNWRIVLHESRATKKDRDCHCYCGDNLWRFEVNRRGAVMMMGYC